MNAARKNLVHTRAADYFGQAVDTMENPLVVLASPAWRGIEADIWKAGTGTQTVIFKHYHPDVTGYVDIAGTLHAADIAGRAGIAPAVLDVWEDDGLIAMEYLGEGWRSGGLHDVINSQIRTAVIAAKKHFQSGSALNRTTDIFSEIRRLHRACLQHRARLPSHCDAYMTFTGLAEQAVKACGTDRKPCHLDGNTANLMVSKRNEIRLIDFDLSANADPYEDAGCFLIEFFDCETEAREGFEEWFGCFSEGLFQRAYSYGILDDLRWGLIGTLMAATSPRTSLEFTKYASWRFMRFGQNSQNSVAYDRLRKLN